MKRRMQERQEAPVRSESCLRRRVSRTDESKRLGVAATGTPWLRLAGVWRKLR